MVTLRDGVATTRRLATAGGCTAAGLAAALVAWGAAGSAAAQAGCSSAGGAPSSGCGQARWTAPANLRPQMHVLPPERAGSVPPSGWESSCYETLTGQPSAGCRASEPVAARTEDEPMSEPDGVVDTSSADDNATVVPPAATPPEWLDDISIHATAPFPDSAIATVEAVMAAVGSVEVEVVCPAIEDPRVLVKARGVRLRIGLGIDPWAERAVVNRLVQAGHTLVRRQCDLEGNSDLVYTGLGFAELYGPDGALLIYGRDGQHGRWTRISDPARDQAEAAAQQAEAQAQAELAAQRQAQMQAQREAQAQRQAQAGSAVEEVFLGLLFLVGIVIAGFAVLARGSGGGGSYSSSSSYPSYPSHSSHSSSGGGGSHSRGRSHGSGPSSGTKASGYMSSSATREDWHRRGQQAAKEGRGHDEPWHTDVTEPDKHYYERRDAFRKGRDSHYRDKDRRR